MSSPIRDRLLSMVGGAEHFERTFSMRTFSPAKRAQEALASGEREVSDALAILSEGGATSEQAEEWLTGYVRRWAKYQHAGARTANWMITGPARFPVEKNRKRMEIEHARSVELSQYVEGAREWLNRRIRVAGRAALAAADEGGHKEKVVNGVRCILNKTLDRVQLIFPDKPSVEERALLKGEAFRWAPSLGVWQRQLTQNGVWAAERVLAKVAA